MSRDADTERLHDAIGELTQRRRTAEPIPYWDTSRNRKHRIHLTEHPPLLVDLQLAVYPTGTADGDGPRGVFGSRSPARDDAIDRLQEIRAGVALWRHRLQLSPRGALADDLNALGGTAGELADDMLHWLTLDVCRWVTWARVVTGWQRRAYAPHVPCPACERTGGLRIRLELRSGCCLVCGADWSDTPLVDGDGQLVAGSIYLLADYVHQYTEDETA